MPFLRFGVAFSKCYGVIVEFPAHNDLSQVFKPTIKILTKLIKGESRIKALMEC